MKQFFHSLGAGLFVGFLVASSSDPVPLAATFIVMHITWMHYEKK